MLKTPRSWLTSYVIEPLLNIYKLQQAINGNIVKFPLHSRDMTVEVATLEVPDWSIQVPTPGQETLNKPVETIRQLSASPSSASLLTTASLNINKPKVCLTAVSIQSNDDKRSKYIDQLVSWFVDCLECRHRVFGYLASVI